MRVSIQNAGQRPLSAEGRTVHPLVPATHTVLQICPRSLRTATDNDTREWAWPGSVVPGCNSPALDLQCRPGSRQQNHRVLIGTKIFLQNSSTSNKTSLNKMYRGENRSKIGITCSPSLQRAPRAARWLSATWAREDLWENLLKFECEARSQDPLNRPSGLDRQWEQICFLNATDTPNEHYVTTARLPRWIHRDRQTAAWGGREVPAGV